MDSYESQSQPADVWILGTMPLSMMMIRFWTPVLENRLVPSQSPGSELRLAWRPSSLVAKKSISHGSGSPFVQSTMEGEGDAKTTCQTHQGGFVTPMIFFTERGGFSM